MRLMLILFVCSCATTQEAGPPFLSPPPSQGDMGEQEPCAAPTCKLVLSEKDALQANIDARGVDFKQHMLMVIGAGGARYEAEAIDIDDAVVIHAPLCEDGALLKIARHQKPLLVQRYKACP